jgi:hypothetical protein
MDKIDSNKIDYIVGNSWVKKVMELENNPKSITLLVSFVNNQKIGLNLKCKDIAVENNSKTKL